MLQVGLTGGIGSGKSAVAGRLVELGAVLVDADRIAREVVAPGTPGLAEVARRFGSAVLAPDGALDRAALGELVFSDPRARADLEGITHPLVRARSAELVAQAPKEAVVVHDVPLLVEKHLGPAYHLVVVVDADEPTRVERLVSARGLREADARSRIAVQAGNEERRAAADVWLDNSGTPQELRDQVDRLWHDRLLPFNDNLVAHRSAPQTVDEAPYGGLDGASAPGAGERVLGRIRHAVDGRAKRVQLVDAEQGGWGPQGRYAVRVQVEVRSPGETGDPALMEALRRQGLQPLDDDGSRSLGQLFAGADPGLPVVVRVGEVAPH
jgi:dephospho-CoA kinase